MLVDTLLAGMSETVVKYAKYNIFIQTHLSLDVIAAALIIMADGYDSVCKASAHIVTDMFGPVVGDGCIGWMVCFKQAIDEVDNGSG